MASRLTKFLLEKKHKMELMGILNVTPDSFSDGGLYSSVDSALKHALSMIGEGADIIDIGGESNRPGSEPVSVDEELRRTIPVIEAIRRHSKIPISIDTTKSEVARVAISAGADIINDISAGKNDPQILEVAAETGKSICLMHMKGTPKTMQKGKIYYKDVCGEIFDYLAKRIEVAKKAGVSKKKIIVDPGIGFGKRVEDNISILKGLKKFKKLGCRVLVGASRKTFIGKLLSDVTPEMRIEGSLAALAVAAKNGADIIRVHDVIESKRFLTVMKALS